MKTRQLFKSLIIAGVCAFALAAALGCSSGATASSSASSETSASSEAASAEVASSESASSEAASTEATASTEAVASEASSSEAASSEAASSASQEASASSADGEITAENAESLGYQVFEGTVRVCSAEELIELQNIDIDPAAAGGGGTYAVLVFDEPTDVTGMSADGSGERTESSNMLGIAEYTDYESFVVEYGDLDACKALDGQHVKVAAQADNIMFPSDVRFPIGQPSANTSIILQ
ncbi:MAG: hypothetical protein IJI68_09825 [Eggerthellaceae bacterium]|nr:hypothetical protein [Eggerthellaceae bacterium]